MQYLRNLWQAGKITTSIMYLSFSSYLFSLLFSVLYFLSFSFLPFHFSIIFYLLRFRLPSMIIDSFAYNIDHNNRYGVLTLIVGYLLYHDLIKCKRRGYKITNNLVMKCIALYSMIGTLFLHSFFIDFLHSFSYSIL